MNRKNTRIRIIEAADKLFYQQGFEHTSFAQIAEAVGISRGNFYYHFKTKDDILDAVIKHRLEKTSLMLEKWDLEGQTPAARIESFINILLMNRTKIKRFGCPVGTLSTELVKLKHSSTDEANKLFTLFRTWLRKQFEQLGRKLDADDLAMHLLARSQGIATLSSAFQDEKFIRKEVVYLCDWLSQYVNDPKSSKDETNTEGKK